ncbi:MAG TPA: hypothetical protein VIL28_16035, partial [Steroidobacteraceae bacterium]
VAAREGNELPGTPQSQFTAAVDYSQPIGSLVLDASLWATYVDRAYRDIENTGALRSDDRTVVNARLTLSNPSVGWSAYVFAENLFDEEYVTSVRSLVEMLGNYHGAPRTVGIGVRYDF